MGVQVDFANRDSSGTTVSIGGRGSGGPFGRPWHLTVADARSLVADNRWLFVTVGADGKRSLVTIANGPKGPYLTSSPDNSTSNNLDRLPPVNSGIPLGQKPSFPESPYVKQPVLLEVLRGTVTVPALRGGSFPTQPAPAVGIRIRAPWPAHLLVDVNGRDLPDLGLVTFPTAPQGGFYVEEILAADPNDAGGPEPDPMWLVRVVLPEFLDGSQARVTIRQRTISRVAIPQSGDSKGLATRLQVYNSQPATIELSRITPGPRLWDLPPDERKALADGIAAYVDIDVVTAHRRLGHDLLTLADHRVLLSGLEEHLSKKGLSRFVPLPWFAGDESVPDEFRRVLFGFPALESGSGSRPLPPELASGEICALPDRAALWEAMRLWHGWVHENLGGAMAEIDTSPSALIFWPWHAYVDEIFRRWETCPVP